MPRHIPGGPAMTLKIMSGSGGVKAANYVYNVAPKDGAAIALLLSSQPTTEAIDRTGVKYKSANLSWIGRLVDIVSAVTVRRNGPATTLEELKTIELVAGATGPGSTTHLPFAMMNWALGTRFRIVNGYKGSAGPSLAFDRGEVSAASAPWGTIRSRRPHLLGEIQIVQVALEKDRAHPDVPLLLDLVSDPEKKAVVTFLSAQASIGRTVSAPPRVPEDRIMALRKAFDATMKDPKFIAATKKRKMELAPLNGVQVEKMVLEHLSTPTGIVRIAKEAAGLK
jgi:tripartite-type tricarboxylate transporter receptor subunit TctC